jgi:acetyltransferase-like isoleucine patch superfamily enzyme
MDESVTDKKLEAEYHPASGEQKTAMQAALTDVNKSALKKYQELVVGTDKLGDLIKIELLTLIFGSIPGALGLFLRKFFYRFMFKRVGRNVVFGRSITIRHPNKITIGNNVVVDDYAVLDAKGSRENKIEIDDNVIIGRSAVISCKNGDLYIGENTNIAMNCFIQSGKEVRIGRNVLFAAFCYVIGGGDHSTERTDIPIIAQGQVVKGVTIEDNCWIGAGVNIQDGVVIGRDSIIGSGAVVTKDIPPYSIAVGVPAKIMKDRRS